MTNDQKPYEKGSGAKDERPYLSREEHDKLSKSEQQAYIGSKPIEKRTDNERFDLEEKLARLGKFLP